MTTALAPTSSDLPVRLRNKIALRLIPLLCLMYLLNIMDRLNVGFARDKMEQDLHIEEWIFDWGIGIFYVGYLCFEVPANLILKRVGARRWMARIMITWGLVSALTAAVTGPVSFFTVRILLGIAEAGFFPGIVLYLTFWFPARERAKAMSLFMIGVAISGAVSNPTSGAIMEFLHGRMGLNGWQWLFVLEGIPSVIVGFFVLYYLTDNPAKARWLTEAERSDLAERLAHEDKYRQQRHGADSLRSLGDWRVWLLTAVYFSAAITTNATGASMPKKIKEQFSEYGEFTKGLLVALPFLCAVAGMLLLGRFSDRTGKRQLALTIAAFSGAAGWAASALVDSPWPFLVAMCLAVAGMFAMLPTFWVLPTSFLSGAAAAAGIAMINSLANLGGLVGPRTLGYFGPWAMVVALVVGGTIVFLMRHDSTLDRGTPSQDEAAHSLPAPTPSS